ncbi:uncharacterized protein LOC113335269 [Papaver somniferum]|uniref:uncharacterized protein LOC113335269 n=1 Tax=Papaver somniferum TaxID=3469 RepID=UPI000E6F6FA1|nr:uncharacterized protein LOC113335269 [Papaver somniferum]
MTYKESHRRHKAKERSLKYLEQRRFYEDEDDDVESPSDDEYDDDDYDDNDLLRLGNYPFDDCQSHDSAPEDFAGSNLPVPVKLENRYAPLIDDEDKVEENNEPSLRLMSLNMMSLDNALSNENPGDERDYEVFQNIYGSLCVKRTGKITRSIADQETSSTAADDKMITGSTIADQISSSIAADDIKRSRLSPYKLALYKKKKWINSWCKKGNNDKKTFCIYVDGYFRKNRKAGYGVIIRYHSGFPLVASVGVHVQGKPVSTLYHELQRVNGGLELAIKYGIRNVQLRTNSFAAAVLVRNSLYWFDVRCFCEDRQSLSTFGTCERCLWRLKTFIPIVDKNSRLAGVYPLLQEIVGKCAMFKRRHWRRFIISVGRKMNKAADYLAKLHERKEEMSPEEFPEQLKDIYQDAGMWQIAVDGRFRLRIDYLRSRVSKRKWPWWYHV